MHALFPELYKTSSTSPEEPIANQTTSLPSHSVSRTHQRLNLQPIPTTSIPTNILQTSEMPPPHVTFNSLSARSSRRGGERYRVSTDTQFPASDPPYHLCEPNASYPPTCPPASYNAPPPNPHRASNSQSYRVHGHVTLSPHAENGLPFDLGQLRIDPGRPRPEGFVSSPAYASSEGRASTVSRIYEPGSHRSHAASLRDPYTVSVPSSERAETSPRSGASEYSMSSSRSPRVPYSHCYAASDGPSANGRPVHESGRRFEDGVAVGGYTADQASWVSSSSTSGGGGRAPSLRDGESHREGSHRPARSSRRSTQDEEYY